MEIYFCFRAYRKWQIFKLKYLKSGWRTRYTTSRALYSPFCQAAMQPYLLCRIEEISWADKKHPLFSMRMVFLKPLIFLSQIAWFLYRQVKFFTLPVHRGHHS